MDTDRLETVVLFTVLLGLIFQVFLASLVVPNLGYLMQMDLYNCSVYLICSDILF